MLMKKICAFALSMALVLTGLAGAGEMTKPSAPDGFSYVVTIPSTSNLVDNIDVFVAACTRKTQNSLPEGMVKAMAQMFVPGISVLTDNDLELHAVSPIDPKANGILGIVVANTNLDALLEILADNMFDFEQDESGTMRIEVPNMPPLFARDYDGKHSLIGSHAVTIDLLEKSLNNGWQPKPWGQGVVSFTSEVNKNWSGEILASDILEDFLDDLRREVTHERKDDVALPPHIKELVLNVLDVAEEYIPALKAEIAAIDIVGVDVKLDADQIDFLARVKAPADRYLGKLATAAAALPNLDSPLAKNVDDSAVSFFSIAPFEQAFPGAIDAMLDIYQKVADKNSSPELKAAVTKFTAMKDIPIGDMVIGQYVRSEALCQVGWIQVPDPKKALEVYVDSYRAFNDMVVAIEPQFKDNQPFTIRDGKTANGVEYFSVEASREFLINFIQVFATSDYQTVDEKLLDSFGAFSYYFAAKTDTLVFVSGKDAAQLLDETLAIESGVQNPLWDGDFVQKTLPEMPATQTAVAFIDYAYMMNFFTLATLENMASENNYADNKYLPEAFEEIRTKTRTANTKVAIGSGAIDGDLAYQCIIPADTINIIYYNMNILYSSLEAARQKHMLEEYEAEEGDEDGFSFDDDDDSEDEEE